MEKGGTTSSLEEERAIVLQYCQRLRCPSSPSLDKDLERAVAHGSQELLADREAMLAAVSADGRLLRYGSESLRDDSELALAAVFQESSAVEFASSRLRDDKDFMMKAVQHDGMLLGFAGEGLKADRELVLAAVENTGMALREGHESFKADREVVLSAVKTFGAALFDATPELLADREVVMLAVQECPEVLTLASEDLRADREVVVKALPSRRPVQRVLRCASEELRKDKDIVLLAVRAPRNLDTAHDVYTEAAQTVQEAFPFKTVYRAAKSPLAVHGEEAPVVTVSLTYQEGSNDKSRDGIIRAFCCEALLLSGATFNFDLPEHEDRPRLTLNDLASAIIANWPHQAAVPARVFVVLEAAGHESRAVTPWEGDRRLADFL